MNDPQETYREQVRHLFANTDEPPRDVVPPSGLTRETLRRLNDAAGTVCTFSTPGEVVCDVDGMPLGVTEGETVTAELGGAVISRAEAERLGWTAEEFPNITVYEPTTPTSTDNERTDQ